MQIFKKLLGYSLSILGISAALFMSSCAPKNSCDTLQCKNGGTCAADFCNCPTGYDGPECQNFIADRYIGTYAGYTDPRNGQPTHVDTVDVYLAQKPLSLSVVRRRQADAIFTGLLESKSNTINVPDIVNGNIRTIVNIAIKTPTSVSEERTLSLNLEQYTDGKKSSELFFNGVSVSK